jgi:hypothetical protein
VPIAFSLGSPPAIPSTAATKMTSWNEKPNGNIEDEIYSLSSQMKSTQKSTRKMKSTQKKSTQSQTSIEHCVSVRKHCSRAVLAQMSVPMWCAVQAARVLRDRRVSRAKAQKWSRPPFISRTEALRQPFLLVAASRGMCPPAAFAALHPMRRSAETLISQSSVGPTSICTRFRGVHCVQLVLSHLRLALCRLD